MRDTRDTLNRCVRVFLRPDQVFESKQLLLPFFPPQEGGKLFGFRQNE